MSRHIVIADYDPQWPVLYEEEKNQILEAVGHKILAIEHVGSTAVPGLGAKPIIDMMAGVHHSSDAEECLPLLRDIGYTSVTPQPDDPDHYYCLGKGPHSVGYHLHLMKFGSNSWEKHLLFRDYLRTNPDVANQYHDLKKEIVAKHGSDRATYNRAKTSFIEAVVAKALR